MENQYYRTELTDGFKIEFGMVSTNEIEPYRPIKCLGITVFGVNTQLDGDLNISEIDSLIEYLTECREYIDEYNESSKPIIDSD